MSDMHTNAAVAEAATRLEMQRLGVSPSGVDQFLRGQIVANPADRSRLAALVAPSRTTADLMNPWRGFQGGCNGGCDDLRRLGVSSLGAEQFLSGQVVGNPADRSVLASLLVRAPAGPVGGDSASALRTTASFTPPIGSNKGSIKA